MALLVAVDELLHFLLHPGLLFLDPLAVLPLQSGQLLLKVSFLLVQSLPISPLNISLKFFFFLLPLLKTPLLALSKLLLQKYLMLTLKNIQLLLHPLLSLLDILIGRFDNMQQFGFSIPHSLFLDLLQPPLLIFTTFLPLYTQISFFP